VEPKTSSATSVSGVQPYEGSSRAEFRSAAWAPVLLPGAVPGQEKQNEGESCSKVPPSVSTGSDVPFSGREARARENSSIATDTSGN
jgi:hypothetical protein